MHRIDTPNNVGGLFADPDPLHGQGKVVLDAAWANDVQENIMAVLAAAGVAPVKGDYDNLRDAILALITGGGRQRMLANTTFYVDLGGLDTNDGSVGAPWLTPQHAANVLMGLDLNGFTPTVDLAAGQTFTGGITIDQPLIGGAAIFQGGAGTEIDTAGTCVTAANGAIFTVKDTKLISTGGNGITSELGAVVTFDGLDFGACASAHMSTRWGGRIRGDGSAYTVSGDATYHARMGSGDIVLNTAAIAMSGARTFADAFLQGDGPGTIFVQSLVFSGPAATGPAYSSNNGAFVNSDGTMAAILAAGFSAGSVSNGGLWD
ncbi:MAG TPA: hypothetical protein VGH15_04695 [Caulobacteraceae bacterium]|jgi:hypothetical protein